MIRGQFADLPGVRLWYLDSGGAGQPVVFAHANTGTSESWASQLQFFASAGYRVITFDRRGWGRSLPDRESGEQPGTMADDLDALLTLVDAGPVHLVAVAGGVFGALDFTAWRPERVRTLVAGASTGNIADPEITDFIARIHIPAIMRPSPAHFRELSAGFRGSNAEATRRWIEIESRARQRAAPTQPVRTANTYAKLNGISVPALVLAGSADLIAPPAMMRLWAAQLRDAEFKTIVGAGHSVAYEEPLVFNAAVHGFFRKHDIWQPTAHREPPDPRGAARHPGGSIMRDSGLGPGSGNASR